MSNEIATVQQPSVLADFAKSRGMRADQVKTLLVNTCFKTDTKITDEQLQALIIICNHYNLDPLLKQIYAFPHKGAIIPVVGVDGWIKIVNNQDTFSGFEYRESPNVIKIGSSLSCPEWIECTIHHEDRMIPSRRKAYLRESYKDSSPAWKTHTISMLENRAYIKCARFAFGISGIYDEDDARIITHGEKTTNKKYDLNKRLEESPIEGEVIDEIVDIETGEITTEEAKITENEFREALDNITETIDDIKEDSTQEISEEVLLGEIKKFESVETLAYLKTVWQEQYRKYYIVSPIAMSKIEAAKNERKEFLTKYLKEVKK